LYIHLLASSGNKSLNIKHIDLIFQVVITVQPSRCACTSLQKVAYIHQPNEQPDLNPCFCQPGSPFNITLTIGITIDSTGYRYRGQITPHTLLSVKSKYIPKYFCVLSSRWCTTMYSNASVCDLHHCWGPSQRRGIFQGTCHHAIETTNQCSQDPWIYLSLSRMTPQPISSTILNVDIGTWWTFWTSL